MLENLIVGTVVFNAAVYAGWKWAPKRLRGVLGLKLAEALTRVRLTGLAQWLGRKSSAASGCGDGCSNCQTCGTPSSSASESRKTIPIAPRQ